MSATIRDIAHATHLSVGTVSRALKNQSGLTEVTRAKVHQCARELGYDFAKLRQGRLRRIVFLLHSQHNTLSSSPFYSPVLHGAEEACRRAGLVLSFIAASPTEPVLEQIRLHQTDAILCAGFFEPELLAALRDTGKPLALIDLQALGYHSINPDNRLGGYLATKHLIQCGRKRIAMLSGSLAHYSVQERVHGFRKALYDARMLANPALEICIPPHLDHVQGVKNAMQELLALPARPDAIFCYNDSTAILVMRYCLDAGLKVPHDIAIVGFDDISAAAMSVPPLTTIRVNKEALGAAGVELLLQHGQVSNLQKLVDVELIVRESSTDD